jgi:3-methylfumaryl-CoA hydratase
MPQTDNARATHDLVEPGPARRLAGLLDVDAELDPLPPLWHWVYFLDAYPQRELGPDGHPMTGVPAPPGPGYRRMFAGGRVEFHRPLRVGVPATRRVRVASTSTKPGRSGPLTFVTTEITIAQDDAPVLTEQQDIVYISADTPRAPRPEPTPPGADEQIVLTLDVDPTLLFRFSALTYNAHRIHYDRDYACSEGHADLVIHGPLQALLLAEAARRSGNALRRVSYRLHTPAYGAQAMTAYGDGSGAFILRDAAGRATASAETE